MLTLVVAVRHSGPQGQVKPLTIIDDPADWTSTSLKGREAEYTYYITQEDITELLQVGWPFDIFHRLNLPACLIPMDTLMLTGRGYYQNKATSKRIPKIFK